MLDGQMQTETQPAPEKPRRKLKLKTKVNHPIYDSGDEKEFGT